MQILGSCAILLGQHLWEPEEGPGALENQWQRQRRGVADSRGKGVSLVLLLHLLLAMLAHHVP